MSWLTRLSSLRPVALLALLLSGAAAPVFAATAGEASARSGLTAAIRPFLATADARADIAALLGDIADPRPILLTFGANWCSDSRSLAAGYREPELAALLEREFRVLFVNVGKLDRNLDLVESYGDPIDKGIPSVVLLSPAGELLHTDHGSLSSAEKMSQRELMEFFTRLAAGYARP